MTPAFQRTIIGISLLLPSLVHSQWDLFFDATIPVQRQGVELDLAWAGGLNFVQLGSIDLDQDGMKDLVLFDRSGNKLITLVNTGAPGPLGYRVSRAFDSVEPFSGMHDWVLLKDYNCDGKEDIFTYSQAGFSVYRNTSTSNELSFTLATYRVNSNYVSPSGAGTIANLFVSQVDLPGFIDVDNDGDLDILTFSLLGSYVEYHKNLSMETYGNCDSLLFELRNKCWGYFAENFNNNAVTLNVPCSFNVPSPEVGGGGEHLSPDDGDGDGDAGTDRAHAGSSVTPIDLDGDGDKDLLLGDISFNNIVALTNGGSVNSGLMTAQDIAFPSNSVPVDLPIFPGAFYEDVDKDGKRDLVVSPNATSLAQNFRSMWYYRNTNTDASPVFQFQQQNLFQDRMIDLGEGAYPVLFDHNGDGLMDLVVSNHGYFDASGTYPGKMALLQNVGTAQSPAFTLVTDDYMSLSTSGIGSSMYPAFADLDGDGDLDMYIGDLQGRLHFFRNVNTGPVAQFQLALANITDEGGAVIDVGQYATPVFHDLDGDQLLDLIIGERNGNLNYYRNSGTASSPAWTMMNENLGAVSTVEWWNVTGHSVPFIFTNGQGAREILLGSESGWLYHYGGIDGNVDGSWTLLDSTFHDIKDGARTSPCLYDFTGDGTLDMVLGNFRGGLSFWRSDPISVVVPILSPLGTFAMWPNPASDDVELVLDATPSPGNNWVIRDALGKEVQRERAASDRTRIETHALPAGVYLVRLEGTTPSQAQRLMILHAGR